VHLVGFIITIYHDARSPERQIRTLIVRILDNSYYVCYLYGLLEFIYIFLHELSLHLLHPYVHMNHTEQVNSISIYCFTNESY